MITLSMIVKNEEKHLKGCLESVNGVADEIVIVDTGSTDNTLKICGSYNAKILHYKWDNDFAAARNFALENSTGDWILYLDADERLSEKSIETLKQLTAIPKYEAYHCTIKNIDEIGDRPSVMKYVRVFPNDKRIRFRGKIHEQIEYSLIENEFKVIDSDIEIIHLGYSLSEAGVKTKAERNRAILLKEYEQNPSSYYAFQLGQTYGILNDSQTAIKYFEEAVKDFTLKNEYKSLAYRFMAINKAEKQLWNEALSFINKSLEFCYEQPLNLLAAAKIYLQLKDFEKADHFCRSAFEINDEYQKGKNSFQAILLNEESIIYEGLIISSQSLNKDSFNYYYERLRLNKNKIDKRIFKLVDILINKKSLDSVEEYLPEINNENLELILTLLEAYDVIEKINLLEILEPAFSGNLIFLNKYGLTLFRLQKFDKAEEIFEKAVASGNNPSAVFYLVSVYLQNNKIDKVPLVLQAAENKFSNQKEIIERLNTLKEKISSFFAVH